MKRMRKNVSAGRGRWKRMGALGLLALVLAALALTGCGSSGDGSATASESSEDAKTTETSSDKPTIYMVGAVANNAWWAACKKGFEQGGEDFGMNPIYTAPEEHADTSAIPLIESALASNPAGIAINYYDKTYEQPTLEALEAGVEVALFNTAAFEAVPDEPNSATTNPKITELSIVGEDVELNAEDLARELVKHLEPSAKVLIVDPVPGVSVLVTRRRGLEKVLKAEGFSAEYLPAGLDEAKNFATISGYMEGHDDIGGIVGLGGPTGNPAAQWVEKTGNDIAVGTFDVDSGTVKAIENGSMIAATDQQPYLQGYLAAMNLSLMIQKSLFPVSVNTGSYIVTKANVAPVAEAVEKGFG